MTLYMTPNPFHDDKKVFVTNLLPGKMGIQSPPGKIAEATGDKAAF